MFKRRHVLQDAAPGVAGGGDGGASAAAADPAAAPAGDGAAPAAAPAGSALAAPPAAPSEFMPEKFRVMGADGKTLDVEASARKLSESYTQLEGRFRAGDAPPKTAEEYTVTVPDAFKDHWQDNDRSKAFRAAAHAQGLTQRQLDFVMDSYFKAAPELVGGAINNSVDAVKGSLQKAWGDQFTPQLEAAQKAFAAFADEADRDKFDSIMTDPALAYRILAKVAPELQEGRGVPAAASAGEASEIKTLLTSEAAANPKHPEHAATRAKIDAYYAKTVGNAPVN